MFHSQLEDNQAWRFVYLPETSSTNMVAKSYIANARPKDKTVVFTDHQTDGLGQYGREWITARGLNLTASFIFPFDVGLKVSNPFLWNMYIAIVIHQTIAQLTSAHCYIKWPNDLIIDHKKVGGILIQNSYAGNNLNTSIVGVGINLNQMSFGESLPNASSLKLLSNRHFDPLKFLIKLTFGFIVENIGATINQNNQMIVNLYNKNLYQRGKEIECEDSEGNRLLGILKHVNHNGNLVIETGPAQMILKHGDYRQILNSSN